MNETQEMEEIVSGILDCLTLRREVMSIDNVSDILNVFKIDHNIIMINREKALDVYGVGIIHWDVQCPILTFTVYGEVKNESN